jgi:hypothetical protein
MEGNGSNDPRIQALLREGEQKMKPSLMTKLIWGASYDDAADCFSKAGNLLKNAKNCTKSTYHSCLVISSLELSLRLLDFFNRVRCVQGTRPHEPT